MSYANSVLVGDSDVDRLVSDLKAQARVRGWNVARIYWVDDEMIGLCSFNNEHGETIYYGTP